MKIRTDTWGGIMKVLNLYSGIGGNRLFWGDEDEITAVEIDKEIAMEYKKRFPQDRIIIGDAHRYLLENYMNYDIIWSSPPCPTHSDIRRVGVHRGLFNAVYPDMTLYQEIILLKNFFKGQFIVENVKPYYKPLIPPNFIATRHIFWINFFVPTFRKSLKRGISHDKITTASIVFGFNIRTTKIKNKQKVLRNLVNPELGKFLFDYAKKNLSLSMEF